MIALHFIGVMNPAIDSRDLQRVRRMEFYFGAPDFIHRRWDVRAWQEVVPGDVAIFAEWSEATPLDPFSFDDSALL